MCYTVFDKTGFLFHCASFMYEPHASWFASSVYYMYQYSNVCDLSKRDQQALG